MPNVYSLLELYNNDLLATVQSPGRYGYCGDVSLSLVLLWQQCWWGWVTEVSVL